MVNSETSTWLDFALECEYITIEIHKKKKKKSIEVGKLINFMINNPDKFGCNLEK